MQCSTSLTYLPIAPRLPRALGCLLILGLLLHLGPFGLMGLVHPLSLPVLIPAHHRRHQQRRCNPALDGLTAPRPSWDMLRNMGTRLLARSGLLILLLHTSGSLTLTPWTNILLLIPLLQTGLTLLLRAESLPLHSTVSTWPLRLQRLYQLVFVFLLGSTLVHLLGYLANASTGLFLPMALGVSATSPDEEAEIHIDPLENHR